MSIASELTRLASNIGTMQADVNATLDAIAHKGVPVPAGSQLHDVPGLVERISGGGGGNIFYENIGGKPYPCVQIDDMVFACENLDLRDDANILFNPSGEQTVPACWYFNGGSGPIDEGDGLLYNWYAVNYIEKHKDTLLGNGWRVMSRVDRNVFVNRLNSSTNGNSIKAKSGWIDGYEGIDILSLNYKSNGRRDENGVFDSRKYWGDYWLSDNYNSSRGYDFIIPGNSDALNTPGGSDKRLAFSVRCCRPVNASANTVTIGDTMYKYVRVGNFYIITENLRYHTSAYYYPNNNSANEASQGLLYQAKIMFDEIIPILPNGWRVPSLADFQQLHNIEPSSNKYISSIDGGTNDLFTNVRLSGYRNSSSSFVGVGSKSLMWSTTANGSSQTYNVDFTKNASLDPADYSNGSSTSLASTALSVRVIKDV